MVVVQFVVTHKPVHCCLLTSAQFETKMKVLAKNSISWFNFKSLLSQSNLTKPLQDLPEYLRCFSLFKSNILNMRFSSSYKACVNMCSSTFTSSFIPTFFCVLSLFSSFLSAFFFFFFFVCFYLSSHFFLFSSCSSCCLKTQFDSNH